MEPLMRRYIMLRAAVTGAGGFARLEVAADRVCLQVSARGLKGHARATRVFLREAGGEPMELGAARVNAQGCATLETSISRRTWRASPERAQALLLVSDDAQPRPLLYGLCARASAESLTEAQAALRKLCACLNAKGRKPKESAPNEAKAKSPSPAPEPPPCQPEAAPAPRARKARSARALPRCARIAPTRDTRMEAIDPGAYRERFHIEACERPRVDEIPPDALCEAIEPERYVPYFCAPACEAPPPPRECREAPPAGRSSVDRLPADRLPALCYPGELGALKPLFDAYPPFSPFGERGWRYVRVPLSAGGGYAVGIRAADACVREIAYAFEGDPGDAPPDRAYRWQQGVDGRGYWVYRREVLAARGG